MFICYVDESGTVNLKDQSKHFAYLGFAIPAETWKEKDQQLNFIKDEYHLKDVEIHTAWMLRPYFIQEKISKFDDLSYEERKKSAKVEWEKQIAATAVLKTEEQRKRQRKEFRMTLPYLHLTRQERKQVITRLAKVVGDWNDSRAFCEVVKKEKYDPTKSRLGGVYEDAFQQVVTRFESFLSNKSKNDEKKILGLIVADNNESLNNKLTETMRKFHLVGTAWKNVDHIIETPLFVDSQLTSMIQIADLISYAVRRFFDNGEDELFNLIYHRFDRVKTKVVGIRHYTPGETCSCKVCKDHEKPYLESKQRK